MKDFFQKEWEIDEIKEWEEKIERKDLIYQANKYKYDFPRYKSLKYKIKITEITPAAGNTNDVEIAVLLKHLPLK